ncbi:MAG: restriction endonuclease subunit S [Acidithiobacillus ferrooxidans]|nr:restriction endonuclease subunit S [Acidithiobacillus ferrooxidans]MDD5003309.1 restriction endonuclease subunit S [Acidithiobacillus sp.]MDD5379376.1 restriction endonuclease subunit S [Acidithiobacillus sp.]MDD5575712.1 restriction endonuclease subunit S [Acidithiobacillus sp.]
MASDTQQTPYGPVPSSLSGGRLGDLCLTDGVQTGPFGSQLHQEDYVSIGIPIITVEHLGDNRVVHQDLPRVSDEDRQRLAKYSLKTGDIVFSRVGSVDRRAIVREAENGWLFSGRCLRVRPDPEKLDSQWLSYFFGLPAFKQYIRGIAVGATMPSINTKILSDVPIYFPTLTEQRSAAKCLASIDEKIDINRRINQTLEAMAQTIFKSWFVDFVPVKAKIAAKQEGRNPLRAAMSAISGKSDLELDVLPHEQYDPLAATAALFPDEMEELALGGIPRGWAFQSTETLAEVGIGKTPPRKEPQWFTECEGDWRWVSIKDMGASGVFQQRSSEFLTSEAVSRFNVRVVPDRIVLLSFKLTIGRVAITDGPMVTNEAIAHFKLPSDAAISSEYLYLYLKGFDYSTLGSTSSIADAVNSKTIREMPIIVANRDLIHRFSKSVAPLFGEIRNRQNEIASLSATRDALLPKLLSGEIEVPA